MSLTVHEFSAALTQALAMLDKATGAEDRVKTADRQLADKQSQIDAMAAAHHKLKEDSDKHLQDNFDRMNAETAKHNAEVEALKKQIAALQEMHKTQQENASSTLTNLNARIAVAKADVDKYEIEREKIKQDALDYAKRFM